MTKRLVFIVEGDCEVNFINTKVIPFLYSYPSSVGWSFNAQKITTNRKLNRAGGNCGFELFKNEVRRVAAQRNPWITSFMDFYAIPADYPGYAYGSKDTVKIELAVKEAIGYEYFMPYIQKYEFETLLFSDVSAFDDLLLSDRQREGLMNVTEQYADIEDIDGGSETAPSKRLSSMFGYRKVLHSKIVLDKIPIRVLMEKSAGFKRWINSIMKIIDDSVILH